MAVARSDAAPADRPYRGPGADRPVGIPLPPDHLPLFRRWQLRKSWHYISLWSPELVVCANAVRVGPLRQEYWAVWDRVDRRLWKRTHVFRHRVRPVPDRLVLGDGEVWIDVALDPTDEFEVYRPDGRAYIWSAKEFGAHAKGTIRLGRDQRRFEGAAFVDIDAGYHARHTSWRWMAGAGPDQSGRAVAWSGIVGLMDTPEASERTLWVDGAGYEIGPVRFSEDLTSMAFAEGGELRFTEEAVLAIKRNFLIIRSNYAHAFGTYSGTLPGGIEVREGFGVRERFDASW